MSERVVEQEAGKDVVPQKEDLEREKLRLEIEQLKEVWWKKPAYMLAALPTLLAVLSLIYGFANGYFQATAVKLENQKHELAVQKGELEARVKELTKMRAELEEQRKLIEQAIKSKEEKLEDLTTSEQELRKLLEELEANVKLRESKGRASP